MNHTTLHSSHSQQVCRVTPVASQFPRNEQVRLQQLRAAIRHVSPSPAHSGVTEARSAQVNPQYIRGTADLTHLQFGSRLVTRSSCHHQQSERDVSARRRPHTLISSRLLCGLLCCADCCMSHSVCCSETHQDLVTAGRCCRLKGQCNLPPLPPLIYIFSVQFGLCK